MYSAAVSVMVTGQLLLFPARQNGWMERNGTCGEGLSTTRGAVQEDHEPFAFQPPFVAGLDGKDVRMHESAEEALLRVREDKAVHRVAEPVDGLEIVDEQPAPDFAIESIAKGERRAEHRVRVVSVIRG